MASVLQKILSQATGAAERESQHEPRLHGGPTGAMVSRGSFNDFSMGANLDADEGYNAVSESGESGALRASADSEEAQRRASAEYARHQSEIQAVVQSAQDGEMKHHGSSHLYRGDPWRATFNPGSNPMMPRGRSVYDTVEPGAPTTWEYILRSEAGRRLSFRDLDRNGDGYVDAGELKHAFGPGADIAGLMREADVNGDGAISQEEFERVQGAARRRAERQQAGQQRV